MKEIRQAYFEGERALFDSDGLTLKDCIFDNGESPLKESRNLRIFNSRFGWKYPLWYCNDVKLERCTWMDMARAGVWYSNDISVKDALIQAPKNFRRCNKLSLKDVVFTYDAVNGLLTTEDYIMLAGDQKANSFYDYYSNVEISRDRPDSFPVEAPEGLDTETYLFSANQIVANEGDGELATTEVTFDFNTMDVATSNNDGGTDGDITEALTLTEGNVILTVSPKEESATTENRFWGTTAGPQLRVYSGTLTFSVPEGFVMKQIVFNINNDKWNDGNSADSGEFEGTTWTGNAQAVVVTIAGNSQINSIAVTVAEEGDEPEPNYTPYAFQTQVGFDGQDVYFKGFSDDTAEYWAKGTLSEDGKTVTIPANQYMGRLEFWGYVFDYFVTAIDEEGNFTDLVLNYDAETSTFTTEQTMVLNDSRTELNPYQTFTDVVITKMADFAATPADPSIDSYKLEETSYPF